MVLQDGVVLGADTRSTAGTTVADKNCSKIHYITPNIYACGAGTAADLEHVTGAQVETHAGNAGGSAWWSRGVRGRGGCRRADHVEGPPGALS